MLRILGFCLCALLALVASGCGVGIVALALWIDEAGSHEGSGNPVVITPPKVEDLSLSFPETSEKVQIDYRIVGTRGGPLHEEIKFASFLRNADGQFVATGAVHDATPAPGTVVHDPLPDGEPVRFVWDAGKNMAGVPPWAQIRVIPWEGDLAGDPKISGIIHAGKNTPVSIQSVQLSAEGRLIVVSFFPIDDEMDRVTVERVEMAVEDGELLPLPPDAVVGVLPLEFPSAPSQADGSVSFVIDLTKLREDEAPPELCALTSAGFHGKVSVRIWARDFPAEPSIYGDGSFTYDNNEPPFVEILPIDPMQLTSGIIPIRCRIFDPDVESGKAGVSDMNLAEIGVEVDLGDGLGFQKANEFPRAPSEGLTSLRALSSELFGDPKAPFHTFLWEAASQAGISPSAVLGVTVQDKEPGPRSILPIQLSISALRKDSELATGLSPIFLASGDFDGDRFLDVVVANSDSGDVTFLRGDPGGLRRTGEIQAGNFPRAAQSGDFDGDAFPDVVVANRDSDNVTFLRGGAGGLRRVEEMPAGDAPRAVTVGDYDADGFPDAVVANEGSNNVTYLRGGAGGLHRVGEIPAGDAPRAVTTGDFDGDAFPDVVVANSSSSNVTYLRGGASGLQRVGEIPTGDGPWAVTTGNFDGDAFLDVVVANSWSSSVTYLRGGAGGLVAVPGEIYAGPEPEALASGDFDGDDFPDVVVANKVWDHLTCLRGGPGGLRPPGEGDQEIDAGVQPLALTSGDFDEDGFADVVVVNECSESVTYLRGGAGGLSRVGEIPAGERPAALASADFDADGYLDIAVANLRSASVTYLRGAAGGLSRADEIPVGKRPAALASADFDGDKLADVVVANMDSGDVTYLRGGAAGPSWAGRIQAGGGPRALASGHFDGDEFADVAVANMDSGDVTYLRGGATGLSRVGEIRAGGGPRALAGGHFDGDAFDDVLVANANSGSVTYLRGGNEGLRIAGEIPVGAEPWALASGDFDGDGFLDAAVANGGSASVTYLRGGTEGIRRAADLSAGRWPQALSSGDFDGDSFPDVAVANSWSGSVTYLRGGPEGLRRAGEIRAGAWPMALSSGDFDGDGFLDVVAANRDSNSITRLRGGPGGLARAGELSAGEEPWDLASGDFDGDGFLDVAVANSLSDNVTQLRQRFPGHPASAFVDPGPEGANHLTLLDRRNPPRYRLELAGGAVGSPTQVCLIPGAPYELPQGEAFRRGKFLAAVTDPASLLRETTPLAKPALLTLRLRDHDLQLLEGVLEKPEQLRVFRQDPATGAGVEVAIEAGELKIVEFSKGKGVSFPVSQFGCFVVAIEKER